MPGQPEDDQHTLDQYHDHMATISAAINRWRNGEISTFTKRQAITEENRRYYGGQRKSPVTGEQLTSMPRSDDVANTLADAAGLPVEVMSTALRARRRASVMAQQLLDDGGTNEAARTLVAEGMQAFLDITGTGRTRPVLAITGGKP
jgi:uncharacterized protein YbaP (TraB family)